MFVGSIFHTTLAQWDEVTSANSKVVQIVTVLITAINLMYRQHDSWRSEFKNIKSIIILRQRVNVSMPPSSIMRFQSITPTTDYDSCKGLNRTVYTCSYNSL